MLLNNARTNTIRYNYRIHFKNQNVFHFFFLSFFFYKLVRTLDTLYPTCFTTEDINSSLFPVQQISVQVYNLVSDQWHKININSGHRTVSYPAQQVTVSKQTRVNSIYHALCNHRSYLRQGSGTL